MTRHLPPFLLPIALALTACSDASFAPRFTGALAAPSFYPRQVMVIDVPADSGLMDGSWAIIAAPADTERVTFRAYPAAVCGSGQAAPRCDLINFMWNDGGGAIFFQNAGQVTRWQAALHYEADERRGILYVPAGRGDEYRDSVAHWTLWAHVRAVRGASAGRLHATLQTTDAFAPGISPSLQPVRSGDQLLHVAAGDSVLITTELGTRHYAHVTAAPSAGVAPDISDGTLTTSATSYQLAILPDEYTVDIAFTYTNRTNRDQYLPWCGMVGMEQWTRDGWVGALSIACPAIGGVPPITIPANSVYRDTFEVRSFHRPRTYPRFEVDPIPGTYRLRLLVYRNRTGPATEDLTDRAPLEQSVSNTFDIRN